MVDMRDGTCAVCQHNQVIEAPVVDFVTPGQEMPAAVAYQPHWWFGPPRPLGPLKMYVCRQCGFTQWFAEQPQTIPIDPVYKTRLIRGTGSAAPYR